MANEIRTPVALIAAPVEEIAKRAGDLPGLRDDVDIIRKNCERLRTLVDQILNLKSAEEGEHAASCVPERVDVREVLRTVVAAVGDAVPRRGIAVHLGLPGEALTAEMCCDHFSKIMGQILGNAYQFAESRIDVTLEGPGGEVPGDVFRVRVRDDGAGIDRAEKARIFEPFYTSDKCVSGSGLGLGLRILPLVAFQQKLGFIVGLRLFAPPLAAEQHIQPGAVAVLAGFGAQACHAPLHPGNALRLFFRGIRGRRVLFCVLQQQRADMLAVGAVAVLVIGAVAGGADKPAVFPQPDLRIIAVRPAALHQRCQVPHPVLVGGAAALQDALAVLLCPLKDAFAQQCADLLCVHVVSLPCAVAVPVYSIRIPRSTPGCKGRRVKNV